MTREGKNNKNSKIRNAYKLLLVIIFFKSATGSLVNASSKMENGDDDSCFPPHGISNFQPFINLCVENWQSLINPPITKIHTNHKKKCMKNLTFKNQELRWSQTALKLGSNFLVKSCSQSILHTSHIKEPTNDYHSCAEWTYKSAKVSRNAA